MNWIVEKAKNEQYTLKLNDIYLYSKYNPKKDVERFMHNEVDFSKKKFIVVGLGLGYHLEFLLKNIENVEVQYIVLDSTEKELLENYGEKDIIYKPGISEFSNEEIFNNEAQIIIPQSFLTAIGEKHPLFYYIEDIKIRQVSYARFKEQMKLNFNENIKLFKHLEKNKPHNQKAALISSGPSLNETVDWLKNHQDEFDIFCVGSALKVALKSGITPQIVFITDAQENMIEQITSEYKGKLIFLSTANYRAVLKHTGLKQIIFQSGYSLAEEFAFQNEQPLFETGGSVATTAFSYIKWVGYKTLYLFGQDLSFTGEHTHAENSTSGRKVDKDKNKNTFYVEANDGTFVQTTPNLMTYKRWFERAVGKSNLEVINTAARGANISGTTFLNVCK